MHLWCTPPTRQEEHLYDGVVNSLITHRRASPPIGAARSVQRSPFLLVRNRDRLARGADVGTGGEPRGATTQTGDIVDRRRGVEVFRPVHG